MLSERFVYIIVENEKTNEWMPHFFFFDTFYPQIETQY